MTKEEADRRAQQEGQQSEEVNAHNNRHHHHIPPKHSNEGADGHLEIPSHRPRNDHDVERTLDAAQESTEQQTGRKGRRRSEEEKPDRTLLTHTNEGRVSTTLPIVQEARENSSNHSSSHRNSQHDNTEKQDEKQELPNAHLEKPFYTEKQRTADHRSWQQEHEANGTVEFTVTGEDDDGKKHKYSMEAPLDSRSQGHLDVEPSAQSEKDLDARPEPPRRISIPPRIASGTIPTLTPLIKDDEIGIAR